MTNLIIEEVLNLVSSLRSLLVRNALLTLSEIFQTQSINFSHKYEQVFKKIIKKLKDKNQFVVSESKKCLDQ
jgi:hypothetical protein